MGVKSNLKVLCFIRSVESILSLVCGFIHIIEFGDPNEPTTRQMVFWLSYFGYALISAHGVFKILKKRKLKWKIEFGVAATGFVIFIATSIYAMVNVENDKHMVQLPDLEEAQHPYFRINRIQSIVSVFNAATFLIHSAFSVDFINMKPLDDLSVVSFEDDGLIEPEHVLKLHFFFDDIWHELKSNKLLRCCTK